jgi:hypothetical protein
VSDPDPDSLLRRLEELSQLGAQPGGGITRLAYGAAWTAAGGLIGYLAVNQITRGDPFAFLEVQRAHWFQHPVPPWTPLVEAIRAIGNAKAMPTDERIIFWGRLAGAAFAIPVLLAGVRRLRVPDQIYAWGGLVLLLSASWLLSLPRYLLGLYPIFVVEAGLTKRRPVYAAAVATGVAVQVWFFWRYARGWWTF